MQSVYTFSPKERREIRIALGRLQDIMAVIARLNDIEEDVALIPDGSGMIFGKPDRVQVPITPPEAPQPFMANGKVA